MCDQSLCDQSLCDQSLCDQSLCDQSLCDQSLCEQICVYKFLCTKFCEQNFGGQSFCDQSFFTQILSLSQVVFEGVRGKSYKGDIALDDVSIQDGRCPPQALCTFDDPGLCGWNNVKSGDNFDWTRANGRTLSSSTGPGNDHTYGTDQGRE